MYPTLRLLSLLALTSGTTLAAEPVTLADFEAADYGTWRAAGSAFGKAPAQGAHPGQMAVSGFRDKELVNSFLGGDDSTGTLTSAAFRIERKFFTFLIGGGGYAGETCLNLKIAGKVVRTASGPNTESGGSEALALSAWDVAEFAGQEATLEVVDQRKGGWGHINVDHIVLTDDRGGIALAAAPKPPPQALTRGIKLDADFLQLPVVAHRRPEKLSIEVDGKLLRYLHVNLAAPEAQPDFIYSYDLREFRGKEVSLRYKSHDATALDRLVLSNTEIVDAKAYAGPHRPRFHFSPRLGWMNDVNGSYYHDGLYHLFYQANPTNKAGGAGFDMHWGHSVSRDLLHWEEWPIALFPDGSGQCYSGTAVMAQHAIPGLTDKAALPAPVLFFSATTPFSQHIATTPDGGRTWQRFAGNPVVPNIGDGDRDPKVVWHEPSQHYVMVLYVGSPDSYRFLRSKDLKKWEETSRLDRWFECPEFWPVKSAVTGEDFWVLYGCYRTGKDAKEPFDSRSCYQLGRFNGAKFTPVTPHRHAHEGAHFYAALTFMNAPQGRQIMMGWTAGTSFPGEPFNQSATVPLELTVRSMNGEDTVCFEPVKELSALRGQPLIVLKNVTVADAQTKLAALEKEALLDITVRFKSESSIKFRLRQLTQNYDAASRTVQSGEGRTAIHPAGTVDARFLVDRGLIESFWNQGEASYCTGALHTADGPAFAIEGGGMIEELTVYPLRSIWK